MEYIEKVLLATGGHAAPEEVLDSEAVEEPETEAALEKNDDDPCWSGYVQVGMKEKNGKRVPNCVPSSASIDLVMSQYNSVVGSSRHIPSETAYEVARKAYEKYDYLPDEELYSAVLWELHVFAQYATVGATDVEDEDMSIYASLLPEGHPDLESTLTAAATWVAGSPDLDNSSREALVLAFSETSDYVRSLHASTRIRALISSGSLSDTTLGYIKLLSDKHSKVD